MPPHQWLTGKSMDFLQPRHGGSHVFHREPSRSVERIGRGPRADFRMLEAQPITRQQDAAHTRPEQMPKRSQGSAEGPQPRRAFDQRVPPQVCADDGAPTPRFGSDITEQGDDTGSSSAVSERYVIAHRVDQPRDRPAATQQCVKRIDPARKTEGCRGRSGSRIHGRLGRSDEWPRPLGIPKAAKLIRQSRQVHRPAIAGRPHQPQRATSVESRHEQRSAAGFRRGCQRCIRRLKPQRPAIHGRVQPVPAAAL